MHKQSKARNLFLPSYQQTGVQPLPSHVMGTWKTNTLWPSPLPPSFHELSTSHTMGYPSGQQSSAVLIASFPPPPAPCAPQPAWYTSTAQQQLKQSVIYTVLVKFGQLYQQTHYNRALTDSGWMRATWRSALNSPSCCSQKGLLSFTVWKGNDATVPLSSQGPSSLHGISVTLTLTRLAESAVFHV